MRAGPAEPQSSWMHSSQPTPTGKRGVTFLARRRGEVRILPIPSQGFTPVAQVYISVTWWSFPSTEWQKEHKRPEGLRPSV